MNKKTINKVIKRKMNQWLSSIDDLELVESMKKDIIVTGGCIASMLMNEDVNDFDIYFATKETTKKVAEYYCKKFNKNKKNKYIQARVLDGAEMTEEQKNIPSVMWKNISEDRIKIIIDSEGVATEDGNEEILDEPFENAVDRLIEQADELPAEALEEEQGKEAFRPVFLSSNAITLSDKVQVVIRFHGDAKEIHKNYDFIHCTNYWTFKDRVIIKQEALEALMSKELIYSGSKYPLCSIIRTRKFIKRGFHINAGQYLKMCFQVSQLDLNDINVLEDQLVGVDSAYFQQVIDRLRKKKETDETFKIENSYLVTIIDKIF